MQVFDIEILKSVANYSDLTKFAIELKDLLELQYSIKKTYEETNQADLLGLTNGFIEVIETNIKTVNEVMAIHEKNLLVKNKYSSISLN